MRKSQVLYTLVLAVLCLVGCTTPKGEVAELRTKYPVVIYNGPQKPFEVKIQASRPAGWVSLDEISKVAVGAILVSEDWAFYHHKGIDPKQIKEAIQQDLEKGKFARGASTITQQVVKNVFLSSEKSLMRKIKEVWLATQIERVVGKKKILESYLNIAEFGEGVFGISQASRFYFQKPPSALGPSEGAFLAMLLPSPKKYSISFKKKALTPFARKIVRSILLKMAQAQYITPEERAIEAMRKLSFEIAGDPVPPPEPTDDNLSDETPDESAEESTP